ncbi:methyltransferase domain-containing protein, partial [Cloacibacillus porcorum]
MPDIRESVKQAYTEAVESAPRGVELSNMSAGNYDEELLRELPVQSFGCGNPIEAALLKPGERVLDLGSGAGLDLLLAGRRVGAAGHVYGLDMTQAMLDKARKNIDRLGL